MTARLLAAAAGFSATVVAGLALGTLVGRLTGALWAVPVGFFAGLALGIGVIVLALRPIVKSS